MIACTSPAGTSSDTPFRIGLSATVAWRLSIRSMAVLPARRAVGEEVAAHIVHRVLADAFEHALVVERALPIVERGFLELQWLVVGGFGGAFLAQRAAAVGQVEPRSDDRLLLAKSIEQELTAPRRFA